MADQDITPDELSLRVKRCTKCGAIKPTTEFWRRNDRASFSVRSRCKGCANDPARYAKYREQNSRKRHENKLRAAFGLTVDQYGAMLAAQSGVCAICKMPERSKRYKRLAVDHCHDTGINRSLLCSCCNRGLGLFMSSPAVLRDAANYLEYWNKQHAKPLAA